MPARTRRPKKATKKTVIVGGKPACRLIQWERAKPTTDAAGNLICPECGEPAEIILGFFGQPCYAHK